MSNLSVSADKRDTMRLKLCRNVTQVLAIDVVALCKKTEVIFTELSFNGTT